MTEMSANFRLGILIKEFGMIFEGFCWKKGKTIFGLGDEAKFLQSSSWGREGNDFDVSDSMNGWKRLLRS